MLTLAFIVFLAVAIVCGQVYRQASALWAMPAAMGSGIIAAILLPFAFNVYFALIVLAVPLGYGVYRARVGDTPWARPVAGAAATLILVIGAARLLYSGLGCADQRLVEQTMTAAVTEDTMIYDAGMIKLGQRLGERFPTRRVLAVYPHPEAEDAQTEFASLRKGWGAAISSSSALAIGPGPDEYFVARNLDLDDAVESNPGTELLVNFAPLPADYEKLKLLGLPLKQRVALILLRAKPGQLKLKYFQEGLIGAALIPAPAEVPTELKESVIKFRLIDHILVDGGNLEKVLTAFPTWLIQTK